MRKLIILMILVFITGPVAFMHAQDLLIFPKRLTFENDRERSQILNLSNSGKDSATYRISFVEIRMNEDGTFEKITEPDAGQMFASPFLRYYPRQVTLAPNESQIVKVQMVRTNKLQDGEYRSHLYLRAVPSMSTESSSRENNTNSIAVKLTPVYGITIPVIIRKGEDDVKVRLDNLDFSKDETGTPLLDLDFYREGETSVYGNILVKHISVTGKESVVSKINGFGIYTPGNIRRARIELRQVEEGLFRSGHLEVTYYRASTGNRTESMAEAMVNLP